MLRNICWWLGLNNDCDIRSARCIACQCTTNKITIEPLHPSIMSTIPWHIIAIDFASTPTSEKLLNVYDEGSRKLFAVKTNGETAKDAIRACQQIFDKYGVPSIVKSDNGPAFISFEFKTFAKKNNFIHRKVTPLHPEANGAVERSVQIDNKAIKAAIIDGRNWREPLKTRIQRYNETPHSMTGVTLNALLTGSRQNGIFPSITKQIPHDDIIKKAKDNDDKRKALMKKYRDKRVHAKHNELNINDPILEQWDRNNKFKAFFDPSPYRVIAVNGTMITAQRNDKTVTRNSKKFKKISEDCYKNAMIRLALENRTSQEINPIIYAAFKRNQTRHVPLSPPVTPAVLALNNRVITRQMAKILATTKEAATNNTPIQNQNQINEQIMDDELQRFQDQYDEENLKTTNRLENSEAQAATTSETIVVEQPNLNASTQNNQHSATVTGELQSGSKSNTLTLRVPCSSDDESMELS